MKKTPDPLVVKDKEVPAEILATAIKDIAEAAKKLLASRLTKRALLVLLRDSTNIPMSQIEMVLDHASQLERYIKR